MTADCPFHVSPRTSTYRAAVKRGVSVEVLETTTTLNAVVDRSSVNESRHSDFASTGISFQPFSIRTMPPVLANLVNSADDTPFKRAEGRIAKNSKRS